VGDGPGVGVALGFAVGWGVPGGCEVGPGVTGVTEGAAVGGVTVPVGEAVSVGTTVPV